MPAFLVHHIMAENVYNKLDAARAKKIIGEHMDAFLSGAQGGDYFQLYRYYSMWAGRTYKMYGYALHRARPQRFFCEGAEYIKQHPSDTLLAFFYGYITHYCLDYYLHPHINKGTNAMTTHNTLESAIDVMYAKKNGIDALSVDKGALAQKAFVKDSDVISTFFDWAMNTLFYGFTLKPNSYATVFPYFIWLMGHVSKPDEKRLRAIKRRDRTTILQLKTLLYHSPEEIEDWYDYDFYFERIDKALEKSMQMIDAVDAYLHDESDFSVLWSVFYNINFHGVPVTPREERLAFRRAYKKAKLIL
ncbi:MAG: zinc dependent phospholipase C family protein [Christensenellaceae bacterium]|jgi:hypothetical protein